MRGRYGDASWNSEGAAYADSSEAHPESGGKMDATVIADGLVLLTARAPSCLVVQRPGSELRLRLRGLTSTILRTSVPQWCQAFGSRSQGAAAMKTASDRVSTVEEGSVVADLLRAVLLFI
jgi:hypothetical protein